MNKLFHSAKHERSVAAGLLLATISMLAACDNGNKPSSSQAMRTESPAVAVPAVIPYDIVAEYPHDPSAFTEGLEYRDGYLYESTGQYGVSDIRRVDLKTGKVLASQKMDKRYFGEGLTLLNGKLYQLTYREGKGFIYDANTLMQEGAFTFSAPEGWGMTSNGVNLIFDDGGNVLHFIDPNTFKEVKQLAVTDEHGPVNEINELELIHGYIYANQWRTDNILKIDTATGRVVGRADLSGLRQRAGIPPLSGDPRGPEALNGIAYDAAANRIFITGKNWPKLLEVKLDN
jgi:glutaminyl-peptide cyclotransferase